MTGYENEKIEPDYYQVTDEVSLHDVCLAAFGPEYTRESDVIQAYQYLHRHLKKAGKKDVEKAYKFLGLALSIWDMGENK